MSTRDTSPPAFPSEQICMTRETVIVDGQRYTVPGMSLRDYFAGQALAGSLPNLRMFSDELERREKSGVTLEASMAESAYAMADAMLAERGK